MNIQIYPNINLINKEYLNDIEKFDDEGIISFFADPFTFNIGIAINNEGKVIGTGLIRVIDEFRMALDDNLSNMTKARIIRLLMKEALIKRSCNEAIVCISKPENNIESYSELLKKHFNFYEDNNKFLRLES